LPKNERPVGVVDGRADLVVWAEADEAMERFDVDTEVRTLLSTVSRLLSVLGRDFSILFLVGVPVSEAAGVAYASRPCGYTVLYSFVNFEWAELRAYMHWK
jgi:hypothetical protein